MPRQKSAELPVDVDQTALIIVAALVTVALIVAGALLLRTFQQAEIAHEGPVQPAQAGPNRIRRRQASSTAAETAALGEDAADQVCIEPTFVEEQQIHDLFCVLWLMRHQDGTLCSFEQNNGTGKS
jgi:hypothetical protein